MARPLRIEFDGAFHHVMSRGNDGMALFRDNTDRLKFLELLERAIKRSNWIVHDWVLMTNHFHLAIETPECTLSSGMHWLLGTYAKWFNKRHNRRGHLYQDRFKSVIVDREEYLLTVARYIALNPVKAGMVERPEDYAWCSYRARAGYENAPHWLNIDLVQSHFGADVELAQAGYRKFVDDGLSDPRDMAEESLRKLFLGGARFLEKMQELVDQKERSCEALRKQVHPGRPQLSDVLEAVAQTFDTTIEAIRDGRGTLERRVAAYLAFEDGLIPLRSIADALNVTSPGGISNLVSRCRIELTSDQLLGELVNACRGRMRRQPPAFRFPPQIAVVTARRYHRASKHRAR
jgi:putative transposase